MTTSIASARVFNVSCAFSLGTSVLRALEGATGKVAQSHPGSCEADISGHLQNTRHLELEARSP
eukprot:12443188-Alexandrium_andersonii.AAC.1